MLHRAIFGSLERFIGIITEHFPEVPLWIAPVQAIVLSINEAARDWVPRSPEHSKCRNRVELDDSNDSLGNKISLHATEFPIFS